MNPVSARLIQAVRGPILLITLGVLVAVSQAGYYGFGHTWPVLLIVFGLLKLLEKALEVPGASGPYAGQPPANPPSGGNAI